MSQLMFCCLLEGILGVNICNSYKIREISYVFLILSYINPSNFSVEQFSSGRSDLYRMETLNSKNTVCKNTWMELGQELLYHEEGLLISFFIVIKNKN